MSTTATAEEVRPPKPIIRYPDNWADNIPEELKALRQWVVWSYEWRDGREATDKSPGTPGKYTKVPYQPSKPAIKAKAGDPSTFDTFERAVRAWEREPDIFAGVGFEFLASDPYCGIDVDNCISADGEVAEWAQPQFRLLGRNWGDISPSGRGVKYIVRAELSGTGTKRGGFGPDGSGAIEVYDRNRFFTICGNPIDEGASVEDRQAVVEAIYAGLKARPIKPKPAAEWKPTEPLNIDDEELLHRARNARGTGGKFTAVYDRGDTSDWRSESEADGWLCKRLAFWTQKDVARMERLWLRSAIGQRGKTQERPDYRAMTILYAVENQADVYNPGSRRRRTFRPTTSANGDGRAKARDIRDATEAELQAMADEAPAAAEDDRPEIEITVERHEVVEKAVLALTADLGLYSRGGSLVSVVSEQDEVVRLAGGVEMANAKGSPRVVVQPESVIGCRLTRHAKFYAWVKDKNGEDAVKDVHPPAWLIKAVTELQHWPGIRPLVSVAGAPFIRHDGSIVQKPGYDPITGTLYQPSIDFPAIPSAVSQQAARDAARRLRAVVEQFPFESEDDAAVWLSGLLTAVARPAIRGPVPGIAVIGNRAGCGKGLLIDVVGIAVWGMNVPAFCYPYDTAEANKVKVAIALEGIPAVHFDNLEEGSTYGNPALDSALTSTIVQDRILGTSKTTGRLALRPCWWLSGNNNVPAKDAYRRWLPCNIATPLERPEEREDIKVRDLRAHVAAKRGEIIRDALVILKAHAEAGYPGTGKPPLGSFEEWDRIVRGAVWFATGHDACATRRRVADESPERLDKIALLEGWRELPGGSEGRAGLTAEEAIKRVAEAPDQYATLHAFFARKSRDGKTPSARQIGNLIRGMKGGRFGGLMFEKAGEFKRSVRWRVAGTPEPSPDSRGDGESGESNESNRQDPKNVAERENISSLNPLRSGTNGDLTSQTHQTHHDFDVSDPDDENWR